MDFIWQSFLLIFIGILLLRISGRKSISQMTLATTVVMISIGTIIVQPIIETSVIRTIIAASIFVSVLIMLEYFQLKFNFLENMLTGKSIVVIENGQLNEKNLKRLRLTVDQLEKRLRQAGISNFADLKTGTIETNGQLGYEFSKEAKPLTVRDFKKLMQAYGYTFPKQEAEKPNIFTEVNNGHSNSNPEQLQ
ncbi:hypothetical protein AWM68_07545 [Fictibacillus phosphorivorans]|uniref:YetF C-terminal domain-containing protein n=1 Tax=Fictibacillus phosphorivorans TaxID=1221500 RepID=A0A163R5E7_9BACL|nr:YetF domain-containing protein [Fictibacillus phosphorivorans]KZE66215.1 hypothetical protein AWM68_07545 [Fictibacillus phosphorivorans]